MIEYIELKKMLEPKVAYPNVPKLPKNERYASLIYENLAGEQGELTAITQYMYQYINIKEQKGINKIMQDISRQEMKHLEILKEILMSLGEKPIYQDSKKSYWTAKNIKCNTKDLKEIMKINIGLEDSAINGYRLLLKYTNNMYLRKIYELILIEEKNHKMIFQTILNNI